MSQIQQRVDASISKPHTEQEISENQSRKPIPESAFTVPSAVIDSMIRKNSVNPDVCTEDMTPEPEPWVKIREKALKVTAPGKKASEAAIQEPWPRQSTSEPAEHWSGEMTSEPVDLESKTRDNIRDSSFYF